MCEKVLEKLQVTNLPPTMNKEGVEKLMSIFGKVKNVEIILDPIKKSPNGQCYVEFSNELELLKAVSGAMGMKLGEYVLETKKVPISQTADALAIGVLIKNAAERLVSNPESADNLIGITSQSRNLLEAHPSRVIKLKNLVNFAELLDNNYYDDLLVDIT